MASRIDSFSDVPEVGGISNIYGQKLKAQVEERLEFYKTGAAPRKNVDVMHEAMKEAGDDQVGGKEKKSEKKAKKEKKKSKDEAAMEDEPAAVAAPTPAKKEKRKRDPEEEEESEEAAAKRAKKEAKKGQLVEAVALRCSPRLRSAVHTLLLVCRLCLISQPRRPLRNKRSIVPSLFVFTAAHYLFVCTSPFSLCAVQPLSNKASKSRQKNSTIPAEVSCFVESIDQR